MREIGTHQGRVIIECDKPLSAQQLSRVSEQMQQAFPSGCVILTDGLRISRCEQMDRIEAKLDWLLEALSGDEEGDEAPPTVEARSLDGGVGEG